MVTMGSVETSANPNRHQQSNHYGQTQTQTQTICDYEKCREERIKENLERMQKLGILDLSLKLKSTCEPPNRRNSNNRTSIGKTPPHLAPSGPVRRSSRLGNVTPVSYAEVKLLKKDSSIATESKLLREGPKPEVYTDEHEKLLGHTNMSWTLFVDGYGKDGKRIYDPVRGKTCHQCRQKTLGHRTQCSQCNKVQGQFCGDCLYMRYGENVLEANQNPEWICPVCRGICNCSLCRQAKGWAPTGMMYKKISSLGYKSVAHYLVQTQRSNTDLEKDSGSKVPVSAKRSLPFSSVEETPKVKESADSNNDLRKSLEPEFVDDNEIDEAHKGMEEDIIAERLDKEHVDGIVAPECSPCPTEVPELTIKSSNEHQGLPKPEAENNKTDVSKINKKEEGMQRSIVACEIRPGPTEVTQLTIKSSDEHRGLPKPEAENNKIDDDEINKKEEGVQSIVAPKSLAGSKRKASICTEPMVDSIGARLRQRRRRGSINDKVELIGLNEEILNPKNEQMKNVVSEIEEQATNPRADSNARRLRPRRR